MGSVVNFHWTPSRLQSKVSWLGKKERGIQKNNYISIGQRKQNKDHEWMGSDATDMTQAHDVHAKSRDRYLKLGPATHILLIIQQQQKPAKQSSVLWGSRSTKRWLMHSFHRLFFLSSSIMWCGLCLWGRELQVIYEQAGRYLPVVVDASCIHPFSSWVPLNCICISYPFPSMIWMNILQYSTRIKLCVEGALHILFSLEHPNAYPVSPMWLMCAN